MLIHVPKVLFPYLALSWRKKKKEEKKMGYDFCCCCCNWTGFYYFLIVLWPNSRNNIIIFLPERPYCIHCRQFQSFDTSQLIEHCRFCTAMPRPNPYRHKFVCYACSYSTYLYGNIKKHVYVHLGEKPFACPLCDYRAVVKQSLLLHTASKHRELLKH